MSGAAGNIINPAENFMVDTDGKFTCQGNAKDWETNYPAGARIIDNYLVYSDFPGMKALSKDITELVSMFTFRVSAFFPDNKKVADAQFSVLQDAVRDANGVFIAKPDNTQANQKILATLWLFGIDSFNQVWGIPDTWVAK